MKKCTDCYEWNEDTQTRCVRCGRLLETVSYGNPSVNQAADGQHDSHPHKTAAKFEVQHEDAPNVMRTDRSVYRR